MTRTGKFALSLLLFASAGAQAGQVIYTCAGRAGVRILQDTPCAASGARQLGTRSYEAPRDAPEAARRLELIDRQVHAEWAADREAAKPRIGRRRAAAGRYAPQHAGASRRDLQRARCQLARIQVDDTGHSRRPRRDRGQLEDEAIDACFAL